MFRRRCSHLVLLESYEVESQPVVRGRLSYVPWVQQAVRPYVATRVPRGARTRSGLEGVAHELRATVASGFLTHPSAG